AAEPNPDLRSGAKTTDYQAAFREGGGVSIAALARCARSGVSGELSSEYLTNAIKAYDHLMKNNLSYCDDGVENIIDDYCALLAAIELYKATNEKNYLTDATSRMESLLKRVSDQGFFWSDKDSNRPFYHAADEGLPVVALLEYMELVPQDSKKIKSAISVILNGYSKRAFEVSNPFSYPRLSHVPPVSVAGENNIASGKQATVSQVQSGYSAGSVCDGDIASRWASGEPYSDTEWVVIDLGGQYEISSVLLNWEAAYGKKYDIMVSDDNTEWKTVAVIENGVPGASIHKFDPVSCKYVKMQGRERGIEYGFSLYEFEVYGSVKNTGKQPIDVSFFIPHKNETGYWWQGENARISSISAAIYLSWNAGVKMSDTLLGLASSNLDWILGKNPFGVCMMYGKGILNYPNYPGIDAFPNVVGGICNGITAEDSSDSPLWKPYDDGNTENWRWIEQWLPHNAWYVLAVSSQGAVEWDNVPDKIRMTRSSKNRSSAVKYRIAANKLNLTFPQKDRGICTISTLSGKIVSRLEFDNSKSNNVTIPLNSISNGMYVVRINGNAIQQSIPVFLHN
ncbi:MAG: discoidin domain-containing protein, partial [Fibrobacter sp.]|nr:discoidin domain-containing protein [Fibrobacter sp.]